MIILTHRRQGFTIVELLIVIVVIGVLAGLVVSVFVGARDRARRATLLGEVHQIVNFLEIERTNHGAYPADLSGFQSGEDSEVRYVQVDDRYCVDMASRQYPNLGSYHTDSTGRGAVRAGPCPVAHWELGGNARDRSVFHRHGAVAGDPALVPDHQGRTDGAYQFDGIDDYIDISSSGLDDPAVYGGEGGSSTASFWIYAHNQTEANGFAQYMAGFHYFHVRSADANHRLRLMVKDVAGSVNEWPESQSGIAVDEWVHVTFVLEGGTGYRLYINGQLDREVPHTGVGIIDYGTPAFGRIYNGLFNGKIDDVRIYDRALSSAEIRQIYEE